MYNIERLKVRFGVEVFKFYDVTDRILVIIEVNLLVKLKTDN